MTENTKGFDDAVDQAVRDRLANKYGIKNPNRRQLRKVKKALPKKGLQLGSYKQR